MKTKSMISNQNLQYHRYKKGDHICTRTSYCSHDSSWLYKFIHQYQSPIVRQRQHHAIVISVELYPEKEKCIYNIIEYIGRRHNNDDYYYYNNNLLCPMNLVSSFFIHDHGITNTTTGKGTGYVETNVIIGTDIDYWMKVEYDDDEYDVNFDSYSNNASTCEQRNTRLPYSFRSWKGPKCFSSDEVCDRATYLLDNLELVPDYSNDISNCECFATWCKTGKWYGSQSSTNSSTFIYTFLFDVMYKLLVVTQTVKLLTTTSSTTQTTTTTSITTNQPSSSSSPVASSTSTKSIDAMDDNEIKGLYSAVHDVLQRFPDLFIDKEEKAPSFRNDDDTQNDYLNNMADYMNNMAEFDKIVNGLLFGNSDSSRNGRYKHEDLFKYIQPQSTNRHHDDEKSSSNNKIFHPPNDNNQSTYEPFAHDVGYADGTEQLNNATETTRTDSTNNGTTTSTTTTTTTSAPPYITPMVIVIVGSSFLLSTLYYHYVSVWKTINVQNIIGTLLNVSFDREMVTVVAEQSGQVKSTQVVENNGGRNNECDEGGKEISEKQQQQQQIQESTQ